MRAAGNTARRMLASGHRRGLNLPWPRDRRDAQSRSTEIHLAKKAKTTKKTAAAGSSRRPAKAGPTKAGPAKASPAKAAAKPAKPATKPAAKPAAKAAKKVARKKLPVPMKKKVAAARGKAPKAASGMRRRIGQRAQTGAANAAETARMTTAAGGAADAAGAAGDGLTDQQRAARAFAIEAARMLADDKCTDVVVLDVRGMNSLADYIVVATGTSDRQMRFCAINLKDKAEAMGHGVARANEDERTTWVVLDCMDVVVHIFEPNTRAHYDIENMWADAVKVDWARAAGTRPPGLARQG